jgi:hypothetical protein
MGRQTAASVNQQNRRNPRKIGIRTARAAGSCLDPKTFKQKAVAIKAKPRLAGQRNGAFSQFSKVKVQQAKIYSTSAGCSRAGTAFLLDC